MKKLVLLGLGVVLVACGHTIVITTKTTTQESISTDITDPTQVFLIEEVAYDMSHGDKKMLIRLQGRNGELSRIAILSYCMIPNINKMTAQQRTVILKELQTQAEKEYVHIKNLTGFDVEARLLTTVGEIIVTYNLDMLDHHAFKQKMGTSVYVKLFGNMANMYTTSMPFDTAEALLEAAGGKKITIE